MFANGGNDRSGQDQIPKPTQLDDQNSHATKSVASHFHGPFISGEQSLAKMIPGEVIYNSFSRPDAHGRNDLRMPVKMFDGRGNGINIARRHNDAINAITHDVA